MAQKPLKTLIIRSQMYMLRSQDPIHDLHHAERVAVRAKWLSKVNGANQQQRQALVLAAWWHDVSRSFTKKPSLVWMPFFDDLLSALTLWRETIRCNFYGPVVGMATRMIFCKSLGTGAVLTRLFFRKKNRFLVEILKDADALDLFHPERLVSLCEMIDTSPMYRLGYRVQTVWFLRTKQLCMHSDAARLEMVRMIEAFIAWLHEERIFAWHSERFGEKWAKKKIVAIEQFLQSLELQLRIP